MGSDSLEAIVAVSWNTSTSPPRLLRGKHNDRAGYTMGIMMVNSQAHVTNGHLGHLVSFGPAKLRGRPRCSSVWEGPGRHISGSF